MELLTIDATELVWASPCGRFELRTHPTYFAAIGTVDGEIKIGCSDDRMTATALKRARVELNRNFGARAPRA